MQGRGSRTVTECQGFVLDTVGERFVELGGQEGGKLVELGGKRGKLGGMWGKKACGAGEKSWE